MRASKILSIFLVFAIFCLTSVSNQAISIDPTRISTSAVTNTASSLQSNTCRCDKYNTICDDRCCCDTDCPADIISAWKKQGICLNTDYIYSLSAIPLCSAKRAKTLADLQAGLRIYYQILKILFCVVFDNSDKTDLFKDFQTDTDIQLGVGVATSSTAVANTYVQRSDSSKLSILRPSFGSTQCNSQPIVFGTNQELSSCFMMTTLTNFCATSGFADVSTYQNVQIQNAPGSSTTVTITPNIFIRDVTSISGFASGAAATIAPTTTAPCSCANFVSEVNYRFVVNADEQITRATADIVLTSTEAFDCTAMILVQQKSSVTFLTSNSDYPQLKGPGYKYGDPVLFAVNLTSTTFKVFLEPLSFLYVRPNGECALSGETIDSKYSSTIQFGYRNTFSCSRTMTTAQLNTLCGSQASLLMYNNLVNNLKYVGIFANANPLLIKDWVYITSSLSLPSTASGSVTSCTVNPPILTFFYSAFGEQSNPGFKINSAQVSPAEAETLTASATGSQVTFKLYVDFVRLPQTADLFVAPIPTARLSLPDNVLTPFITKKS